MEDAVTGAREPAVCRRKAPSVQFFLFQHGRPYRWNFPPAFSSSRNQCKYTGYLATLPTCQHSPLLFLIDDLYFTKQMSKMAQQLLLLLLPLLLLHVSCVSALTIILFYISLPTVTTLVYQGLVYSFFILVKLASAKASRYNLD